jgi:hypothetical protein
MEAVGSYVWMTGKIRLGVDNTWTMKNMVNCQRRGTARGVGEEKVLSDFACPRENHNRPGEPWWT